MSQHIIQSFHRFNFFFFRTFGPVKTYYFQDRTKFYRPFWPESRMTNIGNFPDLRFVIPDFFTGPVTFLPVISDCPTNLQKDWYVADKLTDRHTERVIPITLFTGVSENCVAVFFTRLTTRQFTFQSISEILICILQLTKIHNNYSSSLPS